MGDSKLKHSVNGGLIPGLPDDMAMECLIRVPITSHPTLRLVSHLWKTTLSEPSFYSERRRLATAERLLCLIQPLSPPPENDVSKTQQEELLEDEKTTTQGIAIGFGPPLYNLNIYNLTRQQWHRFSINIPTFSHCVALPAAGKVVVLGGWDPSTLEPVNRVIIVDLMTGTWKEGSPMPTARSFFACAAVGSAAVYVAGGHDGQKNALRSAEAYDVESDRWQTLPAMSEERDESHGLSIESRFWVISGYGTDSQGRFRSDAEVYDPETRSWSLIDNLWPYPNTTPKSTAYATVRRRRRWWHVVESKLREFDWEEKRWRNLGEIPKTVNLSSSISLIDVGDNELNFKMIVIGKGEICDGEICEEEGCGGVGVFMVEKEKDKGNLKWDHLHTASTFLGVPFSSSHILI